MTIETDVCPDFNISVHLRHIAYHRRSLQIITLKSLSILSNDLGVVIGIRLKLGKCQELGEGVKLFCRRYN